MAELEDALVSKTSDPQGLWGFDSPSRRMPKKRVTPDRPRDVSQLAKRIVAISTEQEEDTAPDAPSPSASKRGEARAASLTPAKRKKIAKKAALKRWSGREEGV